MFELGKLHQHVSYEDYDKQEGLRASTLKGLMRSPAHYKASLEDQKKNKSFDFGKVVHGFLEKGFAYAHEFAVEPVFQGYTQKGELTTSLNCREVKEKREDWYADLKPGTTVVTPEDYNNIISCLDAVGNHSKLKEYLKDGMRESTAWVKDPATGLTLKFRPDFISKEGYIVDFKTTIDASKDYFERQILGKGRMSQFYILQAAHYCYVAKLLGLDRSNFFMWIAIEKSKPFGIGIHTAEQFEIEYGNLYRHRLTEKYRECLEKNMWPSYPEEATKIQLSKYQEDELMASGHEFPIKDFAKLYPASICSFVSKHLGKAPPLESIAMTPANSL